MSLYFLVILYSFIYINVCFLTGPWYPVILLMWPPGAKQAEYPWLTKFNCVIFHQWLDLETFFDTMLTKVELLAHGDSDLIPLSINSPDWRASLIALFMTHFLAPQPPSLPSSPAVTPCLCNVRRDALSPRVHQPPPYPSISLPSVKITHKHDR